MAMYMAGYVDGVDRSGSGAGDWRLEIGDRREEDGWESVSML